MAMPLALLALVVTGAPFNGPAREGVGVDRSALHSVLSRRSVWRLHEPEVLRTHLLKPNASAVRIGPRRVGRHSAATKVGAAFVGALLGFYIGGTVGGTMDKGTDSFAGAVTGGFAGAAAGAIAGVLLLR
jgi:hypothetical protein